MVKPSSEGNVRIYYELVKLHMLLVYEALFRAMHLEAVLQKGWKEII